MNRLLATLLLLFILASPLKAQITYLPNGSKEIHLLNRLETLSGSFSNRLFLTDPAVSRRDLTGFLEAAKSDFYYSKRSNTDNFNINRALSLSGEWASLGDAALDSRHPVWNVFYKKQTDFLRFNKRGLFLTVNPVLSLEAAYEKDKERSVLWNSTQGVELRGRIGQAVGFYFFGTHNYEEPVAYQEEWIENHEAIPGAGNYRRAGVNGGYEYLKFRGYVNIGLIPEHVYLNIGYDQHFIGDGIRSLFLSDFSEGATFVSLDTKIWKLHYQNIFLRLQPQSFYGQPAMAGHKYATVHQLSVNIRPWLNMGLFESVTFDRSGGFEIGYMNPLIFYRALERSMGSPDKVAVGMDAKAIVLHHLNFYGQFLLNEFTAKEFFGNKGYWANKWGLQLGAKYYDAFTVSNLDLQAEVNLVRPYTYSHSIRENSLSNYTHYNQPLADPLGAGFIEMIGNVIYQPAPLITLTARAEYYEQGVDTGNANFGNNIFKDYRTRSSNYGVSLVNGPAGHCLLLAFNAAYELRPRLFLELGGAWRRYEAKEADIPEEQDLFFHAGFRLNLNREFRDF
jgi:hypothetical protein